MPEIASRRSFLGWLGVGAAAGATAALPEARPAPIPAPISVDRYITEMMALGYQLTTVEWRPGSGSYAGVVERRIDPTIVLTDDQHTRLRQIRHAIDGIDFYDRAAARLYAMGFIEPF